MNNSTFQSSFLQSDEAQQILDQYLVDIESIRDQEFAKAKDLIKQASNKFEKSEIVKNEEYSWLKKVNATLFYPDPNQDEIAQIDQFIKTLKEQCFYLKHEHLPDLLPKDYDEPLLGFDTETTGLDTRTLYDSKGRISPQSLLVGISISTTEDDSWYVPVRHSESDQIPNWKISSIEYFLTRLNSEFCLIIHNAAYDRQVIALNGAKKFRSFPYFFDTQILYYLLNTDGMKFGLKYLSENVLGRKMIDIWDLFSKQDGADFIRFDFLPASNALLYAASDAANTLYLFKSLFENKSKTNPLFFQPKPTEIDHKTIDNLIKIARQGFPVDIQYAINAVKDLTYRIEKLKEAIYESAGEEFNIASGKQVSTLIFEKLKIPILPGMERGKNGQYSVDEETLEALYEKYPDVKFLKYCVQYRKLGNSMSKFFIKFIKNSYVDSLHPFSRVPLSYSQTRVPTGRLSSSSNGQLEQVLCSPQKPTKKNPETMKYKYISSSGDCGYNHQAVTSAPYVLKTAKKLTKIPDEILKMSHEIDEKCLLEAIKEICSN